MNTDKKHRLTQIIILVSGFWFLVSSIHAKESLEELKEKYFKEKKYIEFIDYLEELKKEKYQDATIDYYLALSRYLQLKELEEKKDWEEYFNLRNQYLDKIVKETENTTKKANAPKICLEAKYLNWLIHKELHNEKKEILLRELIDLASDYIQKGIPLTVLKDIAKKLEIENENSASLNLYNLYLKALKETNIPLEQLRQEADNAYNEDNIYLSTQIYEQYIERVKTNLSKEEFTEILVSIIKKFSDYGQKNPKDPTYAENLFLRLKEFLGGAKFNEELQYLRAYNLQRKKEYQRCAEEYEILLKDYPKTVRCDEIRFKLGIIYLYELKDIQKALNYFMNLAKQGLKKQYILSSLYHLGLYHQHRGEKEKAISFYQKILDIPQEFGEITRLTQTRLKEIEEEKPIEYNLKVFLDAVFSEESIEGNLELCSFPGKSLKGEEVSFQTKALFLETGCLIPEFKILWSGDLGKIERVGESSEEFTTSYLNFGTKVVNLVYLLPLQIWGKCIEMIDIEEKSN